MDFELFIKCLDTMGITAIILICIFLFFGFLWLAHFVLTLPMRRAERAGQFLELINSSIKHGFPLEETIISRAISRDMTMGVRFHLLAARLEQGFPLEDSLAKVPKFLPPQITAMLRTGLKTGGLAKMLPASRQLLTDAVSQTRAAISYLVILTFVVTPAGIGVADVLKVLVLPKFREIGEGMGVGTWNGGLSFIYGNFGMLVGVQLFILLLLWLMAFAYMSGPRMAAWFPFLDGWRFRLPWRRKRLQRDFSTVLAILLDSGLPEPEAVALAADCTANRVFRRRAAKTVDRMKSGISLTDAVATMDDSGEFGWRLANAIHGPGGFLRALAGWHESLDAKAFQQEQAAAHGVTSGLVLWTGAFVGLIVVSVFMVLVSIVNEGVLW